MVTLANSKLPMTVSSLTVAWPVLHPMKVTGYGAMAAAVASSSAEAPVGHALLGERRVLYTSWTYMLGGTMLYAVTVVVSPTSMVVGFALRLPEPGGVGVLVGVGVGVGVGVFTLMLTLANSKSSPLASNLTVAVPPGSQPMNVLLNGAVAAAVVSSVPDALHE